MAKEGRKAYTFDGNVVQLDPRQQRALALRSGGMTLHNIGQELGGVCRERARQIINQGARQVQLQMLAANKTPEETAAFLDRAALWGLAGPEE